jgi:hypothetical protein
MKLSFVNCSLIFLLALIGDSYGIIQRSVGQQRPTTRNRNSAVLNTSGVRRIGGTVNKSRSPFNKIGKPSTLGTPRTGLMNGKFNTGTVRNRNGLNSVKTPIRNGNPALRGANPLSLGFNRNSITPTRNTVNGVGTTHNTMMNRNPGNIRNQGNGWKLTIGLGAAQGRREGAAGY